MRQLVEAVGGLVANRSVPGSRVTAPFGTVDDTGRVQLSWEVIKKTGAATMQSQEKPPQGIPRRCRLSKCHVCLTYRKIIRSRITSRASWERTCERGLIGQLGDRKLICSNLPSARHT